MAYVAPADIRKDERIAKRIRDEVELERRKAKVATLEELAVKKPEFAAKVKLLAQRAAEKPAMAAVERRLACEGLLTEKSHHTAGSTTTRCGSRSGASSRST